MEKRSLASKSREAVDKCLSRTSSRKQKGRKNEEEEDPSSVKSNLTAEKYLKESSQQCPKASDFSIQQNAGVGVSCNLPCEARDATESLWEDGNVSVSDSRDDSSYCVGNGLTVEFTESPSSAQRKPIRRASAEDKELAELVHKVHLLCLLARGRLIDSACNDPLIQASLLSLLPHGLLNIADAPKLTANVLAPLVRWFNDTFHLRGPTNKEESIKTNLSFALGTQEGTAEEVVALSVALFRALKLPARFVSILDVVPLKPGILCGSSSPDGIRLNPRITTTNHTQHCISPSIPSLPMKHTSRDAEKTPDSSLACKGTKAAGCTSENLADESNTPSSNLCTNEPDNCAAMHAETMKRKCDLEFELQLEMALSATAVGINTNASPSGSNKLGGLLGLSPPLKRLKSKCEGSSVSASVNAGAVWSRKTGPPLYWSEVYCSGETLTGRWVHVDVVGAVIDGEHKVEAAAAASKTPLRYVVAFAGCGAKDVTRRYCAQWYKVAPHRVPSDWWDAVLAPLKQLECSASGSFAPMELCPSTVSSETRTSSGQHDPIDVPPKDLIVSHLPPEISDHKIGDIEAVRHKEVRMQLDAKDFNWNNSIVSRNSLEDVELETRALTEPLPSNQQAYRNHPLYAIERWLTKCQVLRPKGPVLGFCSGHPVYPRTCVQTLQTRRSWLRDGLQVKENESPAKVVKRSFKFAEKQNSESSIFEEGDLANVELYGRWQMEPLRLPSAVNGIVPKNERGQVELWSEKCLPPGTIHLKLSRLVPVVKRLEVDFAPAMVGFEYRNGRCFPVFEGLVVCSEYRDAILEAYAEEEEKREAVEKKRNETQALSRWYQLLSSMVTRQRLSNSYEGIPSSHPDHYGPPKKLKSDRLIDMHDNDMLLQEPQKSSSLHDSVRDFKLDDNHEHVFPLVDQSFDEDSLVRTKRCPCGFVIQLEEL